MKAVLLVLALAAIAAAQHPIDQYNVVREKPSGNSAASMSTGNGDVGLNVWVEENGDLLLYISKTDAWSEAARLLKLGRVRIRISPNPFASGQPFRQTLQLRNGEIQIRAGKPEEEARISLWADANHPAVRAEIDTARPTEVQVLYERWRDQQRMLEGDELHSAYGLEGGPEPVISYGDSIHLEGEDRVIWYHRNGKSYYPSVMKLQGLNDTASEDPLLHRTFGAAMAGDNFTRMNPTAIRSKSASQKHGINIYALTRIADSSEDWIRELNGLITRVGATTAADRKIAHDRWWQDFWDRSYIRVTGDERAEKISQAYALQRFLNACAGRGAYPIQADGSIFTVDTKVGDITYDADYRKRGGVYSFRDTRMVYWPMLASGDFDLMQPYFRMYTDARPLAQRRTKLYFNHDGVFFPETMTFWGAYPNSSYGWSREGKPVSFVHDTQLRYYFSHSLELLSMLLEYARYRDDKQFARTTIAPLAEGVIDFYDKHYQRSENGKLRISPAQVLDSGDDVVNPLPDVAGLKYVLSALLSEKIPLSKQAANTARKLLQESPDIPTKDGTTLRLLTPAERGSTESSSREHAELYAVFPYRLFGLEKPDLDVARYTFEKLPPPDSASLPQDAVYAAYLGLAKRARDVVAGIFATPNHDHSSTAMMALQAMLLQTDGDKIYVAPAWPAEWDVEFKLHAPGGTIVEGTIREGKIERVKTTPDKRLADVKRFEPQ